MKAIRSAICALLLALAGCAVRVNVGDHRAASDYRGEPKRIFVINRLDPTFSGTLESNFATAMRADLERCGVASLIHQPDSMELDAEAKVRAKLASFKPDSVLNIVQTVRYSYDGDIRAGTYNVSLRDMAQQRDIWKARVVLSATAFADRAPAGGRFAATIIKQMTADGVLKSCPPTADQTS